MGEGGGGVFRILTAKRRKIKMTSKPLCLVILTMRVVVQCIGVWSTIMRGLRRKK